MRRWWGRALVLVTLLFGFVAGMLRDPWQTRMNAVLRAPDWAHPLGTDELGRDVLARIAHGMPGTLGTAAVALAISTALGALIGFVTGWAGGRIGAVVRAFIDVAVALPPLLVALVAGLIAEPSRSTLLIALIGVGWLPFARHADALTGTLRGEPWIAAHRAVGASVTRIWWRSVFPRVLPSSVALAVVRLPALVNMVAALGFLGLGPPPPTPEWGSMIAASIDHLGEGPWLLLAPVVALVLVQTLLAGSTGTAAGERPFGRGSAADNRGERMLDATGGGG